MNKKIILILALFLIALLPSVLSIEYVNDDFDRANNANISINAPLNYYSESLKWNEVVGDQIEILNNQLKVGKNGGNGIAYLNMSYFTSEFPVVNITYMITDADANRINFGSYVQDETIGIQEGVGFMIQWNNLVFWVDDGTGGNAASLSDSGTNRIVGWNKISILINNSNSKHRIYLDDVLIIDWKSSGTFATDERWLSFGVGHEASDPGYALIDNLTIRTVPHIIVPDLTPPGLLDSDAWCTSCSPVQQITNQPWNTTDTTPTINATINESATCAIVANDTETQNSNYTDIINSYSGVACTTTGGANQICTVQESNALSEGDGTICVGCKDSDSNELSNATFCANMTILELTIRLNLDGINESGKYEFRSKVNVSASYGTDVVCINISAPYTGGNVSCGINPHYIYNITTLRQSNFTKKGTNASLSVSGTLNVTMDNRTKMVATYINVTNSGTTTNLNISYYGRWKNYSGDLKTQYIKQTNFIHLGNYKDAVNLSYPTAGSKYIYTDILDNLNNLTFELTGFDLDSDNAFDDTENFNGTDKAINKTLSEHVNAPLGVFDDFESNNSIWSLDDITGSCSSSYGTAGTDGYLLITCVNGGGADLVYSDLAGDIRNSSVVETLLDWVYAGSGGITGTAQYWIWATDDTNKVELIYVLQHIGSGGGGGAENHNITIKNLADDYKTWEVIKNGSSQGTKDLSSLDFDEPIKLKFRVSYSTTGTSAISLFNIKWSGAWLNRSTNNGTYKSNGNITSQVLNVTKTNISRALLSWSQYEPDGTKIKGYMSNNCLNPSRIFEEVQSGTMHVFLTQTVDSNKPCVRFGLNSSINTTSPIIRKYEFNIIPSSIENITIDLEDDGINDWEYLEVLNSTTSPQIVNFTNFPSGYTVIKISSATPGQIQVDKFNLNNTLNPIRLNHTYLEDCSNCTINFTFDGDPISVDGLEFDFYGSWNYTAIAWSSTSIDTKTIQVYYSDFNASLPKNIEWYDVFPSSLNSSNVTPYGQTSSTPIWNITKQAYDENIDVYVKTNETVSCLNITYSNSSFREEDVVNESFVWINGTPVFLSNNNLLNDSVVVFNQTDGGTEINSNNYTVDYADGSITLNSSIFTNTTKINETEYIVLNLLGPNSSSLEFIPLGSETIIVVDFPLVIDNESLTWTENNSAMQLANGNLTVNSETLYNNGTKINKGANYTMNYTNGSITFLNSSALWASKPIISNETLTWTENNSAMQLDYFEIVVDSETLYNNGTKINRGANYTMNYTNGSITFTNASTYWNGSNKELVTNKFNLTYNYITDELVTNKFNLSYTYIDFWIEVSEDEYRVDYTTGNFTLINESYNETTLFVTYNYSVYTSYTDREQFGVNYTYFTDGFDYNTNFTFRLNTSYQKILSNISVNTLNYPNKGIWNWWSLYSCSSRFEIPWVYFSTVCSSCFFDETQLDNYNIIEG